MTTETKRRIKFYTEALPGMKKRTFAALMLLLIAMIVAVVATYAWVTLSYAPEVQNITTTFAANGALEIALAKEDGSMPDDGDIDESVGISPDLVIKNLTWGNLVNLSDPRYGIEDLALRPAELNTTSLKTKPLKGAVYGADGRVISTNQDFAFARYIDSEFLTSNDTYGVRAIASYIAAVANAEQQAAQEMVEEVNSARQIVNAEWAEVRRGKFAAMGTMISKYAQDKLDDANTNLAPYIQNMIPLYAQAKTAMEAQMDAYVALANFQSYLFAQSTGAIYTPMTWDQVYANRTRYNVTAADGVSADGNIALVGLTQFCTDYSKLSDDLGYLNQYNDNYKSSGTAYYWGSGGVSGHQLNNIVADLIDYGTMTIDLKGDGKEVAVTALSGDNASDLMAANGESRKVYTYNGIAIRFEQLAVDEAYRLNGQAQCTIKVTKIITITVYGQAYTKAKESATFAVQSENITGNFSLAANASVAEDTYGLAVDLWLRCNAEETNLTLEGATVVDEDQMIMTYDGVNRIWGATGESSLTTESTTQGGGSSYIYYADSPEDMDQSLKLLKSMKVAFVSRTGALLATAKMDTVNYIAVNGRITVPLVLDTETASVKYTYLDELNQEQNGYAISTLRLDEPQMITAIVYLDGTTMQNTNVLADAEIQGQLNIQFGSSDTIRTIGDQKLLTAVRSVTASLSKTSMSFDDALTDDDLTTSVTVNISGTQPERLTAFFVRAINTFQGSRERTMTFERQENGSWSADYKFDAPGTYYLRYVRMDGVEYALAEPQRVDVSGFALRSLSWGEGAQKEVTVSTSDSYYTESVSVEFATDDRSKMPQKVEAKFRSSLGDVTVPLSYNSINNKWDGQTTFQRSDTYVLKYLDFDGKRKDLSIDGLDKTLTLNLGMYVEVYNGSGALQDRFETENVPYLKDLTARIFNNAGVEMEGLESVVLFYSNGSSTGTINTDLVWNEAEGAYRGQLVISKAGKYRFSMVRLSGNSVLTSCGESPVYAVVSPDPPTFDPMSACSYYGVKQFAPLTNDAVLDGIRIEHSEAATIEAVVYNADMRVTSGSEVLQTGYFELSSEDGGIYFTGESWCIRLPSYTKDIDPTTKVPRDGAEYTQEGTWQLCVLKVYDCYDAAGNERSSVDPIIWVGEDQTSRDYLEQGTETDASYNFTKLRTTVSCSLRVTVTPGATALGSSSDTFMTRYPVSGIGMYAVLTDEGGDVIPAGKVDSVALSVIYQPNSNSASYGYKVLAAAEKTYSISLNTQDAEDGHRTVSAVNGEADMDWQYVGVYKVETLTVRLGGQTRTFTQTDGIGLPAQYTVTTAGPAAENITLRDEDINQRYTVFGKVGNSESGAVNGTFLQAHDPGVSAKITLTTADNSDTQYVLLDGVTMQLVMRYKDGSTAPNGGYSWSGVSEFENVTVNMTNSNGTYMSGSSTLLAGHYGVQLKTTVGGTSATRDLSDVTVYSKSPTVKVKSVSPTTQVSMNPNLTAADGSTNYLWNNVKDNLLSVQNYHSDYVANVYAGVSAVTPTDSEGTAIAGAQELVAYDLPSVTLAVSDLGSSAETAYAVIGNATNASASNRFTFSGTTATAKVGSKGAGSYSTADGGEGCNSGSVTVSYDIYQPAGEQSFQTITATKGDTTFTVNLTHMVTIRENNSAPPSIRFAASPEGYTTPTGKTSDDGGSFTFTLPSSIGTTLDTVSVPTGSADWVQDGTPATQKLCYVDYPNEPTEKESGQRGSCSSKYSYWVYSMTYTYYKFTKTTTSYTLTTGTANYSIQKGVTGWMIGGTRYSPGQTITVDGVFTAEPIIGELSGTRTFLNQTTQTGHKDHITVTSDGTSSPIVTADSDDYNKNQNNTKAAVMNKEDANKPSGYEWGDPSNKKAVIQTQDYWTDPVWDAN